MTTARRRLAALTGALLCLSLLPATASAGMGRTVFPVGLPAPAPNVDSSGATTAVGLPDGGVILFATDPGKGIVGAALHRDGSRDTSFADDGITHVPVPDKVFFLLSALREADGRILLTGSGAANSVYETAQLVLVRLTPTGQLDRSFGSDGIVHPGVEDSCGSCQPTTVMADGRIVVTGNLGAQSPEIQHNPNAPNAFRWVVARLLPSGAPDPSFGANGIVDVPGTQPGSGFGYGVAADAAGRLTLLGTQGPTPLITRLLPTGAADPTYGGGAPVHLPVRSAWNFVVAPSGAATVLGRDGVARVTPGGAVDASFGTNGVAAISRLQADQIVQAADGSTIVYGPTTYAPRPAASSAIVLNRFDDAGRRTTTDVPLAFGGGAASFYRAQYRYLPIPSLFQNAFRVGQLVPRSDGSFVAAGGVSVVQYAGEGAGRSSAQFAAAALTPQLTLDTSFGPGEPRPTASIRVLAQGAGSAYRLRGVAVRVTASGAGLIHVRVRDAHHRIVADGVEPVYLRGTSTVRVQITRTGSSILRHGRHVHVRASAGFRDLYARTARPPVAGGTLR